MEGARRALLAVLRTGPAVTVSSMLRIAVP
jgi:hypothetical protein